MSYNLPIDTSGLDDGAPVARAVLDYFREHPEQHNQASFWDDGSTGVDAMDATPDFSCGTTACVAGLIWFADGREISNPGFSGLQKVRDHAAKRLGELSEGDAYELFYETTNAEALIWLEEIAGEPS